MVHRAKAAENLANELQRRVDELTIEVNNLHSQNSALEADNMRLKSQVNDLTDKVANLDRENRQLSGKIFRPFIVYLMEVRFSKISRKHLVHSSDNEVEIHTKPQ